MGQFGTCTAARLQAIAEQLLIGTAVVTESPHTYTVAVHAAITDFAIPSAAAVKQALRAATPAHLQCEFSAAAALHVPQQPSRAHNGGIRLFISTTEEEST